LLDVNLAAMTPAGTLATYSRLKKPSVSIGYFNHRQLVIFLRLNTYV
jgi:hypothetical protein